MKGQDFLLLAIEEKLGEGNDLSFLKQVKSTSLLLQASNDDGTAAFPAVVVEQSPYNYGQITGDGSVIYSLEKCEVIVFIESENLNTITDARRREIKTELDGYVESILKVIQTRLKTYNGITNLEFGEAQDDDVKVGSTPTIMIPVPVTVKVLKNSN